MNNVKEIYINKPKNILDMDNIKDMYSSISIPSTIYSYSMAMAYMKDWFLKKFDKSYFKTIYIENKNILNEFKDFNVTKSLKKLKPALAIKQQPHFDFNREELDLYQFGTNMYSRRSIFETSFFKDKEKNMYLSINLDQLESEFIFRIKVSTRAQQIDLYKYMQIACRVGSTESDMIDMDFHVPYHLMLQVAKDAGFKIENEKIINIIEFIKYMNMHSVLPVLYKYRTINSKNEFFLRFSNMYLNISNLEQLNIEDGERQGMVEHNFFIEMTTTLKLPAPKMYMYYSTNSHDIINISKKYEENKNIGLYSIKLTNFPEYNEKKWALTINTEIYDDTKKLPISIDFKDLFKNSDIEVVIKYLKSIYISPSICIDFKMINNGSFINFKMDWNNITAYIDQQIISKVTSIGVYIDLEYFNDQLINIKNMKNNKYISKGYKG